jgi:hypothetical protein
MTIDNGDLWCNWIYIIGEVQEKSVIMNAFI